MKASINEMNKSLMRAQEVENNLDLIIDALDWAEAAAGDAESLEKQIREELMGHKEYSKR